MTVKEQNADMVANDGTRQPETPGADKKGPGPGTSPWRVALIVVSSAALGGLAIAIWNRKSIDSMIRSREAASESAGAAQALEEKID